MRLQTNACTRDFTDGCPRGDGIFSIHFPFIMQDNISLSLFCFHRLLSWPIGDRVRSSKFEVYSHISIKQDIKVIEKKKFETKCISY